MSARARPITRRDVIEHLRAHDCAPSDGPVKVGLEQEWHTYDLAQPGRHVRPDEVLGAATDGGPLTCGSTITVEPGGQVELATPPAEPWWCALDALRMHYEELTVTSAFHHTPASFRTAYRLIADGGVDPAAFITDVAPLEAVPEVLRRMAKGGDGLKTAILPWGE